MATRKNTKTQRSVNSLGAFGRQHQGLILGVLALVIVIVLGATYGIMTMMERRAHSSAEKLVSQVVEHIDSKMNDVRDVTRLASEKAYDILYSPDELEQLVRDFVSQNEFVLGSTVAFEPDIFPERGRCFAPYSWRTETGEVRSRQLGTETDYYEEEWYAETKRIGEEYWCEPYFDEGGAKIMMCTFSIPLKKADRQLVAIMTADVGLDDLQEYISTISPYPDSNIVLRSKSGNDLAIEDPDAKTPGDNIIIKGTTNIGWTVELNVPLTYLMYGDAGIFFFIGFILLITVLVIFLINLFLTKLQQKSSEEYLSVIDAISGSFGSIYILDIASGETIIIRTPEEYDQIVGSSSKDGGDFTERLTKLIEYDCFASDRSRMFWEIRPDIINRNLKLQDRYEVRFRKELDGSISWNEMHVFSLDRDPEGRPLRAVIAFTDVSESVLKEKETQEKLEEALEMAESANRAKTSFLFNMSHDIRTPMNAIIGFTNMALKHIDDKERVEDSLNKMQESGELLLSLINDILDMSRIESGQIRLDENEGDVYLSFANIESTMQEMANAKNISLSFEFGNIEDRYVYADFSRCIRIFVNIITNAIKYTNEGGFVKVLCEQIGSENGFGFYKYTFEDNGIGMSEEFQTRVFDEFSREETATVSGIQGTGLGLAVCRSFVTAMNGTISCSSIQGEGSTFTVILPFRLQEGSVYTNPLNGHRMDNGSPESMLGSVDFTGRKVLLVEDNELNREIAEDILSEEGMLVESATDGSVAVRIMSDKGPDYYDFILMDIQMPIMDGYEATKIIREMYPKSSIPIIALSANAFEEDKVKSITAGMNDHVAKPINIQKLNATLAKYL